MQDPRTYQPPPTILRDRVILITGASDGIGKAVALAAAAHGARVILHGRSVRKLEAVYDAIVAAGHPRPSILPLDFEKAGPDEYDKLVAALEQEFGRLDGLLHNAGMLGRARADRASRRREMDAHHARERQRAFHPHALLHAAAAALERPDDPVHVERRRAAAARRSGAPIWSRSGRATG